MLLRAMWAQNPLLVAAAAATPLTHSHLVCCCRQSRFPNPFPFPSPTDRHNMSNYTLKSLAETYMEDSSISQENAAAAPVPLEDRSDFKLVGLQQQDPRSKSSIVRINHKRHADPTTRQDTKSRVMGGMSFQSPNQEEKAQIVKDEKVVTDKQCSRAAAGTRSGENNDPTGDRIMGGSMHTPITQAAKACADDVAKKLTETNGARAAAGQRHGEAYNPTTDHVLCGTGHTGMHPVDNTFADTLANNVAERKKGQRAAAGQESGENSDPAADREQGDRVGFTWANRRNPVTGEGMTPVEQHHVSHCRTHNMRNQSSIRFMSPE